MVAHEGCTYQGLSRMELSSSFSVTSAGVIAGKVKNSAHKQTMWERDKGEGTGEGEGEREG